MALLKELSLAIFLLLASVFQVWGQPACTSHLQSNSTVDIDQYNNTGLLVIQSLTASANGLTMADCSLRCCETANCSLVIFTEDENNNCLLIHCILDDACKPMPSNTSQWIRSIRNNETDSANILDSNSTSTAAENTSASIPADMTDNSSLNTPSVSTTRKTTILAANTTLSDSENNTTDLSDSSALVNSSSNVTDLGSNDTFILTSMGSDNITVENMNATDEVTNLTSMNEPLRTTDNSSREVNDTTQLGEPVTESILIPLTSPGTNMTSSSENETITVSQNSTLTTEVPAVIIGSNSTWLNSTNATLPSFNGLDGNGAANNTAAEEADRTEEGGVPVASNQSMMMILVATLSVGMLLFITIVAVVSKKAVDGWQRRHYSRIDYLVNGMYN